jgi:hypothetical protein
MQQLKRMGVGSGSEEDAVHSGEKETLFSALQRF